ncbi:MAG: hypothetical protein FJ388_11725, partial [Verrucomicrobia bacterium]|nr:hypothetical protein [Verrucomicrobiota bacterium]
MKPTHWPIWVLLLATARAGAADPQPPARIAELDPLMDCVTFYLSFDGGKFAPDVAAGGGDGKLAGKPAFAPGVAGQAAMIGKGGAGAVFPRAGNFPITRRGAISLWVCPQEWNHRDD